MALDLSGVATDIFNLLAVTEASGLIQLERTTGSTIDPITGIETPGTTTTLNCAGSVKTIDDALIDGSRILQDDRLVVIDNKHTPQMTDVLVVQGERYKIIEITPKQHADVLQVTEIRARK